MRSALSIVAILFAVLLSHGYARTSSLSEGAYLGEVEAVFVESERGVFLPGSDPRQHPGAPAWVHIRFPQPLEDGRNFAVAALPLGILAQPGDVVEMRFGGLAGPSETPAYNVVTALVAGRDAEAAAVR